MADPKTNGPGATRRGEGVTDAERRRLKEAFDAEEKEKVDPRDAPHRKNQHLQDVIGELNGPLRGPGST